MEAQTIDAGVFERIQKLLNLAKDGGATEGEAAAAMEKAQALMDEHNLSMATMEAKGHRVIDGATRTKSDKMGKALYKYQQRLMATIADTNYCRVLIKRKWNGRRYMDNGYILIGRESNVAAAFHQFDYLNASLERILTPHIASNSERVSRKGVSFKEGASTRLCQRLSQRHYERLEAQARDARGHSTHNALVITLEDFAQAEADFNNDLMNEWKPGTTKRNREEREKRAVISKAAEEARRAALTPAQRKAEDDLHQKNAEAWAKKMEKRQDNYWKNRDVEAFYAGFDEANKIGLDDQITRH